MKKGLFGIFLVVLVMVFTGRIAIFSEGLGEESQSELIKMKIRYGQCHPSPSAEAGFSANFDQAESSDDQLNIKEDFLDEIDDCKNFNSEDGCRSAGCRWS